MRSRLRCRRRRRLPCAHDPSGLQRLGLTAPAPTPTPTTTTRRRRSHLLRPPRVPSSYSHSSDCGTHPSYPPLPSSANAAARAPAAKRRKRHGFSSYASKQRTRRRSRAPPPRMTLLLLLILLWLRPSLPPPAEAFSSSISACSPRLPPPLWSSAAAPLQRGLAPPAARGQWPPAWGAAVPSHWTRVTVAASGWRGRFGGRLHYCSAKRDDDHHEDEDGALSKGSVSALDVSPEELRRRARMLREEASAARSVLEQAKERRIQEATAKADRWLEQVLVHCKIDDDTEVLNTVEQAQARLVEGRYCPEQVDEMFERLCQLSHVGGRDSLDRNGRLQLLVEAAGKVDEMEPEANPNKRWRGPRVEHGLHKKLFAREWGIDLETTKLGGDT